MAANELPDNTGYGRRGIIQAVQTPLGFFTLIVLIVEMIFGVFVFKLEIGTDRTFVIQWMILLIFALVMIVAIIAIWKPWILAGKEPPQKEAKYSLLIGPPENLRNFDITLINWDKSACFLVCGKLKEKIALVRARVGPTFHVNISYKLLEKVKEEAITLDLKDQKGNRWEVRSFYLYENLLPLSLVEDIKKIIQDYGDSDQ
jgi:energy-coupling factor transporter transmembrane protein EcfT